jgi:hypothetical protein
MSFSWSKKERLKNEGFQNAQDQMTDREQAVIAREREVAKRAAELEAKGDRINILNANHDTLEVITNQARFDLEKASFESDKADFEITKKLVANDKLQIEKTLEQAKDDFEAQMQVKLMEQAAANLETTINLHKQASLWESEAHAKEDIIKSKDQEITRLDELLKVTISKLTQIDVKGLTIHVENEHKFSGKDKE